jgi:Fe-S cluster assembly ATP-binding protein
VLEVRNLSVSINETQILNDFSIAVSKGEIHALVGPNGSGKTTLANVITGKPGYKSTGTIKLNGVSLDTMTIAERAKAGIFMSFQHPPSIPGVANFALIKEITGAEIVPALKKYKKDIDVLNLPIGWEKRGINEGASGGEKSKNELLQFLQLNPSLVILDEIDSGLDVDAIKLTVNVIKENKERCGWIMISHSPNVLTQINPTHVHVLENGRITHSGGMEIIENIEEYGFKVTGSFDKV